MFLCTNKKHNLRQVSPPPNQEEMEKFFLRSLAKQLDVSVERAEDLLFLAAQNVDMLLLIHAQGYNMNSSHANKLVATRSEEQKWPS